MMRHKFYSTKEVLKKVGISRNTLFLWFKHRKIPQVQRDRNGYHIFTERDIQGIMDYKNKIIPSDNNLAFTLVELMIASALLVSILGAFLLSFNSTLKNTNYSQGFALARRACQSKLEEMINHNFDSIVTDYSPGGNPGATFNFSTSELNCRGSITIIPREDLYEGGEHLATANANWPARFRYTSLVYDNKVWVMGGTDGTNYKNDVWYSIDGANWNCTTANATWSPREGHTSVVYDNKMWIIGGHEDLDYKHDVWYSADGINWIQATNNTGWSRELHTSLVYDNKMWIMGGMIDSFTDKNDVWSSTNGINWTCATPNAGWSARSQHTSLVYDNKMWIMGGWPWPQKDVWYSTNGINWTLATNNASWLPRIRLTSLVYDNKMWVMGGTDGVNYKNDVWYSTNGINWTLATNNASWSPRESHTSVVYDSKMWVMGGWNTATGISNDVWYSAGYNRVLEVFTTAAWRHYDGRSFGEDRNLNGTLDAGEDLNNNSRLDSPVQLRAFLSDKGTTGVYLGKSSP